MLLLWPEPWRATLLPGRSWLSRGKGEPEFAEVNLGAGPHELLAALANLLPAQIPKGSMRRAIDVVVSDSVAAVVTLPWQDNLATPAEWKAYALACFEREGLAIDERWTMETACRQHGDAGIGYALPTNWLREVIALLSTRGLSLRTVMPLSAAAYWRRRPTLRAPCGVLILREPNRLSAVIYTAGCFVGLDVEPVIDNAVAATSRLLTRVQAHAGTITEIHHWYGEDAWLRSRLPDAAVSALSHDFWS